MEEVAETDVEGTTSRFVRSLLRLPAWQGSVCLWRSRGFIDLGNHHPGKSDVPIGGVVFDSLGNLYGAAQGGGKCCGVAFEMSLSAGKWKEKVLHAFDPALEGTAPRGNLIFDASGNLYGTTTQPFGTVYELIPKVHGWQIKTLYVFSGADGFEPVAGLTFDISGNLYGTTLLGGSGFGGSECNGNGCGTAFELTPHGGTWTERVLYSFSGKSDGENPQGGLLFQSGDLVGVTSYGGDQNDQAGDGVVFRIAP